jgi:DNA-binding CsgD family transcriptional regulator
MRSSNLPASELRSLLDLVGRIYDCAVEALGIAKTTAKTHLARLFAKTGTNRQSVLVALANKLATAPIGNV